MSWIIAHDPDEWETVTESGTYGKYPGTAQNFGWGSVSQRRRTPEEVTRLKAERLRMKEDMILAEADAIRIRRATCP